MSGSVVSGKDRFTSLDTLAASRELRRLVGAHVDKVFDLTPAGTAIVVRAAGEGRREILVLPGRYVLTVERSDRHAEELGPFARDLRRLLTGARLIDVPDPAGERYVELVFRRGEAPEDLTVGVELFGDGNLVVARGPKLVAVQKVRRWAHREVRIGAEYARPPTRGDPFARSQPEVALSLGQSRTDRASTLAARLGFGGPVAEELLARSEVPGDRPAPEDADAVADRLVRATESLLGEVGDRPRGHLYVLDGVPIDVAPVPLRRWSARPEIVREETPTFSEAAERYFDALPAIAPMTKDPRAEARGELERLRERQATAVGELTASVAGLKADAGALLTHFPEADAALRAAEAGAPEVEIVVGDRTVVVRRGLGVREAASGIYEEAKRLEAKLDGAAEALDETVGKLAALEQVALAAATAEAARPAGRRPSRPKWFERYRWFVSSEGILVVGGRDAASNDLLVRRYLKDGDVYVHAEIHGAPSVLVKHPPPGDPPATETTLVEAGQWGVSFSKAWRAELASARAFWATPDQLSKAGASGEFVAKGAWVIHGTKHPLGDLPTELAVGEIEVEGDTKWTVAPPRAVQARGTVRAFLTPGDERDRAPREIALARTLGLARDRLQALLPAGGISVRLA